MNEVKYRWKIFRVRTKVKILIYGSINYYFNFMFNNINAKYDKDEDEMKAHVFDVTPEYYKPVRISFNVNISKMTFKDLKKEIRCF